MSSIIFKFKKRASTEVKGQLSEAKHNSAEIKDKSVEVKDKSIEVKDRSIEVKDRSVKVKDKSAEIKNHPAETKDESAKTRKEINNSNSNSNNNDSNNNSNNSNNSNNNNNNYKTERLYLDLLRECLLDAIYGSHHIKNEHAATKEEVDNGLYWPKRAHTMIGRKRLNNIEHCIRTVVKNNVPGDVLEAGVWRGGATIYMRGILKALDVVDRKVFVCDSFQGLPPPEDKDDNMRLDLEPILAVSLEEVMNNFSTYNLLDDQVIFIKGFFEKSLPGNAEIKKLSVLRLDGDLYSSTIQILDSLYDKVSVGGFIIIDDFGDIPCCRNAVHDFRNKRGIKDPLIAIDENGYYWIKS